MFREIEREGEIDRKKNKTHFQRKRERERGGMKERQRKIFFLEKRDTKLRGR